MSASAFRTHMPSHVVRRAAFERLAQPGTDYTTWLESQWVQFSRRRGYRNRNGIAQTHFDRHLESLK